MGSRISDRLIYNPGLDRDRMHGSSASGRIRKSHVCVCFTDSRGRVVDSPGGDHITDSHV